MNIILGASGQVGSHIVKVLTKSNAKVRAVVRKTKVQFDSNVEVRSADILELDELKSAMEGGETVFLFTPENPSSQNLLGDTERIIDNYRTAIQSTGIKRIVGLSSIGAHLDGDTGNFRMSRMLEKSFDDIDVKKTFVRPAYYYSNWLGFLQPMKEYGILPSFFPEDLKIEMTSPLDVAEFIAEQVIGKPTEDKNIIELVGPKKYSSRDVAEIFSHHLDKEIKVQPIAQEKWKETLTSAGFTDNTARNLIAMTRCVVDKLAVPEFPKQVLQRETSLQQYLGDQLK